ncbi:conditioned medium-induced protein 4 [Halobacteriales archaeon QS_4_62_28]|nr:MAG: conditioned medium-induced protein 4 [Halobacteriales archaeon QS_4_62_28]
MDEKTEELRDIFVDVAGEETVTEQQEASHGSLLTDEASVEERLLAVIDRLRDRFDVDIPLGDDSLVTVVRRYYEGDGDSEIADAIDATPDDVFRARTALHLLREEDTDAPFDLARLHDDTDPDALAEEFDRSEKALDRYQRIAEAQARTRRVGQRFRSEFEDVLHDAGLSAIMTDTIREDGLEEATEDIGSLEEDADVDF